MSVSKKLIGLPWILVLMLAGCGFGDNREENFVCKPMAFSEGGPRSLNAMGMNIRGNNVLFTGSGYFNMPASEWKATTCRLSKYSNEKLIHFSNHGCDDRELTGSSAGNGEHQLTGQYDYLTKVLAIARTGNFFCEAVR